ncbi:hypothetical protein A2U01_0076305 [Trifolium medium]|uniref:Uncharacterized protein n=1 Tax=Trifolium medium TaxID=97028 RepID=A0A392T427_9FABA|nr:hypothetical protein [Trifolium medium]
MRGMGGTSLTYIVVIPHHVPILDMGGAIHDGIWNRCHDSSGDKPAKLAQGNSDTRRKR